MSASERLSPASRVLTCVLRVVSRDFIKVACLIKFEKRIGRILL